MQGEETDGEFLEIVDSQQISSVIANGFYKGNSLRDLMEKAAPEIMGKAKSEEEVFPISVKMLVSSEKVRSHIHLASGRTMLFIMQSNRGFLMWFGLIIAVFALAYEHFLVSKNFHNIPKAFFVVNGYLGIVFFGFCLLDLIFTK